jgi:hypothetical protein
VVLGAGTYFLADAQPVQGAPALANTVLNASLAYGLAGDPNRTAVRVYGRMEVASGVVASLREESAFPRRVAPELLRLPVPPPDETQPSLEVLRARVAQPAVHLSLGGTYLLGGGGEVDGFYVDGTQRVPIDRVHRPPAAWYADLGFSLGRRLRLGTNFLFAPQAPGEAWVGYSFGTTVTAYGEFVLKPHDPLFFDPSGRWSVALAAGASQSWLSTGVETDFAPPVVNLDPSLGEIDSRSVQESALGGFGRLSAGYYLSNALSVVGALSFRTRPTVTMAPEQRSYQAGTASGLVYAWEEFSSTFPQLDLFVGTRWHF